MRNLSYKSNWLVKFIIIDSRAFLHEPTSFWGRHTLANIIWLFFPLLRDPVSLWLLNGLTQRRKGKLGKLRKLNHRPLMCLMPTLNALRCLELCHWVIFHHIMAMVIRSVLQGDYFWASSLVCMYAFVCNDIYIYIYIFFFFLPVSLLLLL